MDLIPKPDQVASAASNVAHMVLYGGLADLRPMPRTLIDDGPLREVYHYRPHKAVRASGDPVLLVTPLAAPAICFDLRRGCSLVEHLVTEGRPTYLVEYGRISFKNRGLGIEHWIDEVLPEAVKAVSEHAGGRPVHLVGWSLGGIFTTLVAADRQDLPIASLTVLGSPFDVAKVPMIAPLRPILRLTDGGIVTQLYRALGGAPAPLVKRAFKLSSGTKIVTKPLALLQNLDDSEWLAQIEAVDRFTDNMLAYPGRSFGQLYHRLLKQNQLLTGRVEVGEREVDVREIRQPVLVFAGNTDGIAPVASVQALVGLLTGSREVRFEIVPGGHLGMLTGRAARSSTWLVLDEWLDQWSQRPALVGAKTARRAAKKAAARKSPARKAATRTTTSGTTSARTAAETSGTREPTADEPAAGRRTPVAPDRGAIGSNPDRRFSSASSRSLGRKA